MSYAAILMNSFNQHGIRSGNIHADPQTGLVNAQLRLGKLEPISVTFPSDFLGVTILSPEGTTDYTISSPDDPKEVTQEIIEIITSS